MERICVFCGAKAGNRADYCDMATTLGRALVARGLGLVFGGGGIGLMGTVADATLEAEGEAIGVIPETLVERERPHPGLTELHIVGTMHERKALMAELADGFIALPGGFGTLDELAEILTWAQLGIHDKPVGLINVAGYFDPLLALLDRATEDELIRPSHRAILMDATDPGTLLDRMSGYHAPHRHHWASLDQV